MRKLLSCVGLVLALGLASGCTLYFGPDDDDDRYYSYCDQTGCYTCDAVTGQCWGDGGTWGCTSDYDCAAGCYCDEYSGTCVEAGYCSYDEECPDGYVCDDRASCVPEDPGACWDTGCPWGYYCDQFSGGCVPSTTCDSDPECGTGYACVEGTCTPVGCTDDDQCAAGCYCDEASGGCVESGYCSNDSECPSGQTCDESRSTCIPDETPPPPPPPPPPPACEELTTEEACLARAECDVQYTGINCTDPSGASCTGAEANCTCEYFVFDECVTTP